MKIRNNSYPGPEFSKTVKIKHHIDRFAFNFSFLTHDSKYNLDKRSKTINQRVRLKLLDRIRELSQDEIPAVLAYDKYQGLEKMPESQVQLSIHPDFKKSKRYNECEDDYWVFQLGKLGRVIGKKNDNIFYVMSIDASFDQYDHGS